MDGKELKALAQRIFAGAMVHAAQDGETVMEDRRDEHFWNTASAKELLEAAADYFENTY